MTQRQITSRDDFEYWLASIDEFLEGFISEFSNGDRHKLDFSLKSLDLVEAWILTTYPNTNLMLAMSEAHRVNNAACYIGETLRKLVKGKWDIVFDDPDFAYFKLPIIVNDKKVQICPLTIATATADRRKGDYISRVAAFYTKDI